MSAPGNHDTRFKHALNAVDEILARTTGAPKHTHGGGKLNGTGQGHNGSTPNGAAPAASPNPEQRPNATSEAAVGGWRDVRPGEVFAPGHRFQLDVTTGQQQVWEGPDAPDPEEATGDEGTDAPDPGDAAEPLDATEGSAPNSSASDTTGAGAGAAEGASGAAPGAASNPSNGGGPNSAAPPHQAKNSNPKWGRQFRSREDDLRLWTLEELFQLPPPEWLIPDVLLRDTFSVLYAPKQSLKSFIAFDMALRLATGMPWQDRPVIQSKILYLVAEGQSGITARCQAWLQHHNRTAAEVRDHFRVVKVPVNLMDHKDVDILVDVILKTGFHPDLVIIDTIARCMPGGDESAARDMNIVIGNADCVRNRLNGIGVMLVHHPGKDQSRGMRGSSTLPGAADTILTPKRTGMTVGLLLEKQKDGEDGTWFYFRAEKVSLQPLPSCTNSRSSLVLIHDTTAGNAPPGGPKPGSKRSSPTSGGSQGVAASGGISSQARRALHILKALIASEGQPLPTTPGFPPNLRGIQESRWREECNALHLSTGDAEAARKAFRRACEQLLTAGRVTAREDWVWPA